MVSLVIVSHSKALAEALIDLARQVAASPVQMAIAAGAGSEHADFGTDATQIVTAIQAVYHPDGVLVLMDLGSALLSAEMALELLPEEQRQAVQLCAAPLVEGTIAAAVQAGLGSNLATVCAEAQHALAPKAEHLGEPVEAPKKSAASPALQDEALLSITVEISNVHGLHARPAARFVQTAAAFEATIQVEDLTTGRGPAVANSLNALVTLGAAQGDRLRIEARGPQAQAALDALQMLVSTAFGIQEEILSKPPQVVPPLPGEAIQAVPVSNGIAIGPLFVYRPTPPALDDRPVGKPQAEWEHLQQAIDKVRQTLLRHRQQLAQQAGETRAAILDAHNLILQDPELLSNVHKKVFDEHLSGGAAWKKVIDETIQAYRNLGDAYLQQRGVDVAEVGEQVLLALSGANTAASIELPGKVILYAAELAPMEVAGLDMTKVMGVVTAGGGPTSHSAILLRALGIPSVTGVDLAAMGATDGKIVAVDGTAGAVWLNPDGSLQAELRQLREAWQIHYHTLLRDSRLPARMRDGHLIQVAANVGSVLDAEAAVKNGAEGIGVLRTEFLYLRRPTPPSEEEQLVGLRNICQVMEGRPVIVRTLDAGGDKELPYIDLPAEANPFLGVRAIRLSLRRPDLFLPQLRAILRVGADFPVSVMLPMVANLDEVLQARNWLAQAHQELEKEGISHRWPVEMGVMVEIPAAAMLSPVLAPHVDFFSIGTNDLTQYTLAAERGNPQLNSFADALHPAVLKLAQQVSAAAHQHGKWAGVCGEIGGDPVAVPVLAGLGIDEFSMNPAQAPQVKAVIRGMTMDEAASLAQQALPCDSASAVRRLAQEFTDRLTRP